jgi:hypothetical protein
VLLLVWIIGHSAILHAMVYAPAIFDPPDSHRFAWIHLIYSSYPIHAGQIHNCVQRRYAQKNKTLKKAILTLLRAALCSNHSLLKPARASGNVSTLLYSTRTWRTAAEFGSILHLRSFPLAPQDLPRLLSLHPWNCLDQHLLELEIICRPPSA